MHYRFGGGHWIWMTVGWLVGLALLAAVVWAVFSLARPSRPVEPPEAILKRRYAAGEIDTREYETRLAALRKSPNV